MTFSESKTLLSFLWSAIPCAPKIQELDKKRMSAAYCFVLREFSLQDVMLAAIECCRGSSFVPSAFEILAKCKKTLHEEDFLSFDYNEKIEELCGLERRLREKRLEAECIFKSQINHSISNEESRILSDYLDLRRVKDALEKEISEIEERAHVAAIAAYDNAQKIVNTAGIEEQKADLMLLEVF